jgi:predicted ArsR family transcriptional regulator
MENEVEDIEQCDETEIAAVLRGETARRLREAARALGISPSSLIIHIVLSYLEDLESDDEIDNEDDESQGEEDIEDDAEPEDQ